MNSILAFLKPYLSKLLILPPIAAGAILLAFAIQNRSGAEKVAEEETARTLRVITVQQMDFVPRALGYGTSRPTKVWQALAEVKGRVVEIHPDLETGSFAKKGTVLVRIDDTDTKLAIKKLDAEIAKVQSSIAELSANKKNYEESLQLEKLALTVAEQELERIRQVVVQRAGSRAEFDSQQRAVISQRQKVQSVVNSLNLLPSQEGTATANLAAAKVSLAERKRDLERVVIKAPFDCRIGPVQLELNQFVASGTNLFEAQSTEQLEIEAQVALRNLRPLFNEDLRRIDVKNGRIDVNQKTIKRYFDVSAVARYSVGSQRLERQASFERIREELDSQTRAIGVIVVIDKPFTKISDGPPPVSGTYCEIELQSKPISNQIVIPRSAIHQEHVYIVNNQNRLERRKIQTKSLQSEFAVITSGLSVGDSLVVSDPTPAVNQMLVRPVFDKTLMETLRKQASGRSSLK